MDSKVDTDILSPLQKSVLIALFGDPWFRQHFYLTGGTALSAFYLKHRYSDDLDFFTHQASLDGVPELIRSTTGRLGVNLVQLQRSPGFLRYELNGELKIDFVSNIALSRKNISLTFLSCSAWVSKKMQGLILLSGLP
jgi:Nucleotidyl transferase AbiEii toxin, Type IV TA system